MSKHRLDAAQGNILESMGASHAPAAVAAAPADPQYDGLTRVRNVSSIPVDRVVRDPTQPREDFDEAEIDRLAASIAARGQLQAIRVRWDPGQHKYMIIAGERRWRAAVKAGRPSVEAVVHDGPLSAAEVLAVQLIENCVRQDLRPVEQAKAFRRLMDHHGWSTTDLARELNLSQPMVVQAVKLLGLPEEVQRAVEDGTLPPASAYEISKLPDPADQVALAGRAVAGGIRRDDLRAEVRGKKGGGPRSVAYPGSTGVVTVTGEAAAAGPEAVEALLAEVLGQLRARRAG